jgi:hypothetical protein
MQCLLSVTPLKQSLIAGSASGKREERKGLEKKQASGEAVSQD